MLVLVAVAAEEADILLAFPSQAAAGLVMGDLADRVRLLVQLEAIAMVPVELAVAAEYSALAVRVCLAATEGQLLRACQIQADKTVYRVESALV